MSVVQELPARGGGVGGGVVSAASVERQVLLGLPPHARRYLRARARATA